MAQHSTRKTGDSKQDTINCWILLVFVLGIAVSVIPRRVRAEPNRIEVLEGEAQIKRMGEEDYHPVFQWQEIRPGDELLPAEGSVVKVRCGDRQRRLKSVSAGVASGLGTICPNTVRNTDARGKERIFLDLLRGEYVYETALLEEKLILRWSAVEGATSYQVWLAKGNEVLWQQVVNDTQIPYSGLPLQPGMRYRLVVVTNDLPPASVYELGLKLLSERRREIVSNEIATIEKIEATDAAKALMLADYLGEQLDSLEPATYFAAVAPLENLGQEAETATVHRVLGDIYVRLGWMGEAETRYRKSLRLGIRAGNLEEKAKAQEGLAHVYVATRELAESKRWLVEAQENYQLAGDGKRADLVSRWLDKLNALIGGG